jgi:flagellar basal-body rod protein FlgB
MNPADLNVLDTLRTMLGFHNARQRVIAENVANANTPGFTPSDVSQSQFERVLAGQAQARLRPAHHRSAPLWRRSVRHERAFNPEARRTAKPRPMAIRW